MSKKVLTAEEILKRNGIEITGVGIIYAVLRIIAMLANSSMLSNPVNLIINGAHVAILLVMIIGVSTKKKYGIVAGWIFEGYMIVGSILSLVWGMGGPDLITIVVMIELPFALKKFSKALKEVNNNISSQDQDNV